MLGLDQVQQLHLKQKELRIKENAQPVSYYPLQLETTCGSSYSIARRTGPPRSARSSQISLDRTSIKKSKPLKVSKNLDYSCIDSTYDQKRYQLIRKRLEFCLELAGRKHLMCSLSLPYNLLNRISQDVLRMTKSEPSGLNGCLIHVELQELDKHVHHIGQIGFDTQTTPTMELRLRLRRDYGAADSASTAELSAALSARIQKFVSRVISHKGGSGRSGSGGGQVIQISPGFQLVKEKSASSNHSLHSTLSSSASIASAPESVVAVRGDESSNDSGCSGKSNDSGCSGGSNDSGCSGGSNDSGCSGGSNDSGCSGGSNDSGCSGGSNDSAEDSNRGARNHADSRLSIFSQDSGESRSTRGSSRSRR